MDYIYIYIYIYMDFLVAQMVKNLSILWETWVHPWVERSPGGGQGNPLQCSCLENPHGQRSLAGYSPWSHKESATTEWLSTAHSIYYLVLLDFPTYQDLMWARPFPVCIMEVTAEKERSMFCIFKIYEITWLKISFIVSFSQVFLSFNSQRLCKVMAWKKNKI